MPSPDPTREPDKSRVRPTRFSFDEQEAEDILLALERLIESIEVPALEDDLTATPEEDPLADFHASLEEEKEAEFLSNFDPDNKRHQSLLDLRESFTRGFEEYVKKHPYQPNKHLELLNNAFEQLRLETYFDYPAGNLRFDLVKASKLLRQDGNFIVADRVEDYANNLGRFTDALID